MTAFSRQDPIRTEYVHSFTIYKGNKLIQNELEFLDTIGMHELAQSIITPCLIKHESDMKEYDKQIKEYTVYKKKLKHSYFLTISAFIGLGGIGGLISTDFLIASVMSSFLAVPLISEYITGKAVQFPGDPPILIIERQYSNAQLKELAEFYNVKLYAEIANGSFKE